MTVDSRIGPSRTGSVVLNLGEDIGALIVYSCGDLEGAEVEIRLTHQPWAGQHSEVRPRHVANCIEHAAVFDGLQQGTYQVRLRDDARNTEPDTLVVLGGRITRHRLHQRR